MMWLTAVSVPVVIPANLQMIWISIEFAGVAIIFPPFFYSNCIIQVKHIGNAGVTDFSC